MSEPPPIIRTAPPKDGPGEMWTTKVILVRHGEATCNTEGIVGGIKACRGLTEKGRAQVEALASRLAGSGELAPIDSVYSSVLPRAIETASILLPSIEKTRQNDPDPLAIQTSCELCELHPGQADALSWEEYANRYEAPEWDLDDTVPIAPGGESWKAFVDRVTRAITEIARNHPRQNVLIASHAGVIAATMLRFLPFGGEVKRFELRPEHASMTIWERRGGKWILERYNDSTHPQQA